jgi:hypothetical protein
MSEPDRTWRPDPRALLSARKEANRRLSPEEWERLSSIPVSDEERENDRILIRWFRRRYPTAAERLAYVRRAYARWTTHQQK